MTIDAIGAGGNGRYLTALTFGNCTVSVCPGV